MGCNTHFYKPINFPINNGRGTCILEAWLQVKSRLLVHPKVSEMLVKSELENLAKTYGKFWCTWQTDRGMSASIEIARVVFFIFLIKR